MDVNDPVGPSARGSMAPSTKRGQLAVVFDFDNTLATCDVILSVGSSRETVVQCFGGDERVLLMHRLLEHLEVLLSPHVWCVDSIGCDQTQDIVSPHTRHRVHGKYV